MVKLGTPGSSEYMYVGRIMLICAVYKLHCTFYERFGVRARPKAMVRVEARVRIRDRDSAVQCTDL